MMIKLELLLKVILTSSILLNSLVKSLPLGGWIRKASFSVTMFSIRFLYMCVDGALE